MVKRYRHLVPDTQATDRTKRYYYNGNGAGLLSFPRNEFNKKQRHSDSACPVALQISDAYGRGVACLHAPSGRS